MSKIGNSLREIIKREIENDLAEPEITIQGNHTITLGNSMVDLDQIKFTNISQTEFISIEGRIDAFNDLITIPRQYKLSTNYEENKSYYNRSENININFYKSEGDESSWKSDSFENFSQNGENVIREKQIRTQNNINNKSLETKQKIKNINCGIHCKCIFV